MVELMDSNASFFSETITSSIMLFDEYMISPVRNNSGTKNQDIRHKLPEEALQICPII
jgi:hypothetical protein